MERNITHQTVWIQQELVLESESYENLKTTLKLIKPLGIIIYFNIALFMSAAFQVKSLRLEVVSIMITLGILNSYCC